MLGIVVLACRIKARDLFPYSRLCTRCQVHTLPVQASQRTTFVDLDRTFYLPFLVFIWVNSLHAGDICNGTSFFVICVDFSLLFC